LCNDLGNRIRDDHRNLATGNPVRAAEAIMLGGRDVVEMGAWQQISVVTGFADPG
jgi:hypothetical protein